MEIGSPDFWIALSLGGFLVALMSLVQQLMTKEEGQGVRYRAVFRDFFIGAFLTTVIYMLLPESIQTWVSSTKSLISDTITSQKGGSIATEDIELNFGPARF